MSDRKFALDCLPLLSEEARELYIDRAFAGESGWLRTTALRDCATLPTLSPAIRGSVRRLLITMLGQKIPLAEAHAIKADLQRLREDEDLVRVRRVVERVPLGVVLLSIAYYVGLMAGSIWDALTLLVTPVMLLMPITLFWLFKSTQPLSYGVAKSRLRRFLEELFRRWIDMDKARADTDPFLMGMTLCGGVLTAAHLATAVEHLVKGNVSFAVIWVLTVPLAALAWIWGPSTLYVVRHGCPPGGLGVAGLVRMPLTALRMEEHPIHGLLADDWFRRALRSLRTHGSTLVTGMTIVGGLVYVALRYLWIATLVWASALALGVLTIIFDLIRSLFRDLRSRRRVTRAAERGSVGGPAFFSALHELRDTAEAAEYVRLVRAVPRAEPLALDRQALRRYIAELPETDSELLDELGRLDEQLRTR